MEIHLKTKKEKISLILLILLAIILLFLCSKYLKIKCPLKTIFHLPCPSCGLTRATRQIFSLHPLKTLKYNILALHIAILIIVAIILLIIDCIKNTKYLENLINFFLKHYIILIIVPIIISWIINIIRNI